jgi:hypothetical protein
MRKTPNPAPQPKFPPVTKKCKYCHVTFKTPPTYNGQQQEFCIPAHRKAFHKEGRKPILAILKRQEKHMRKIAREEASNEIQRALSLLIAHGVLSPAAEDLLLPQFKMELRPTVPVSSQRSA